MTFHITTTPKLDYPPSLFGSLRAWYLSYHQCCLLLCPVEEGQDRVSVKRTPYHCPHRTLEKLHWEILKYLPYSPDFSPCDYHLFETLKEARNWEKFKNDVQVKEFMRSCAEWYWNWEASSSLAKMFRI